MKNPTTIFIIDDNPLFIAAAEMHLTRNSSFVLLGHAMTGTEGLAMVSQLAPEVVLMDLFLPDMDGYIVTSRIKALPNPPRVIVVSGHSQREFREAARNVAVDGFIPKSELVRELATLLRPATDI